MIANLAGTRPGHALFISDERAVVVDLRDLTSSGPFPEYEVIPAQWDSNPNPAIVPTKAFTLAETALGDVTVITASGSRAGKRTYAVPRNVRESAKRALTASGGTDIDRDIAQRLSSGKPVQYDTVHHIHLYFSTRDEYARDAEMFWGGPGGQQWAEKIASKEMSLVAAASGLHDVQMTPTGAMNPIKNLPPTEDDPDASITDPLEVVDPKEPHVFVPMSFDNPYDCTYCFAPEGAIIHMCDFRQQLINNFGDPSPELAAYDAELAAEDALSENNAGPVTMSGELSAATNSEHSMVASAFFSQAQTEDPSCEYHAEYADSDHIAAVYSSHEDGTWNRWNPQAREWEDAGDASEAGLEPLDDNSAYVAAMHQTMDGVEHVPVRDLHTVEWAMADEAGDEVVDEVDAFDSIVPEFFVEAAEDDETRVTGLYAQRGETWVVWDPTPGIWVPCPQPSGSLSEVEEDDAEELANWLSSAAGRTEAPDTSTEFSLIASVPRVGRRARPANAPGVVPSMGNPGPVSGRSPYASNTLRGGRGNSWATPARTPSGGMSGDYAKRVKLAPATTGDQGYTPQERSANAKQQVRDGFGRFARGGSRVAYAGGNGTIKKVNPETKQVQIESDPDSKGKTTTSWVDAKSTRVMPPNHGDETPPQRGENRRAEPPGGSRVDGQPDILLPADGPRATRYTAKARLKTMQAPLTRAALTKMLKDAPAYFRAERARARRINRNWNSSDGITASANHDGVMVAFFLDPETAQQFAVDGGEPPESLHMTLAYLGDQNEAGIDADGLARVVGEWAAKTPPITGEISGHGVFTNGDKPVTHMSVDCPDLPAARQSLIEHLQAAGLSPRMDHGFDPHITLAYADTPVDVPATPVTFNHVTVSHGANDMDMPMGGAMAAAATPTAIMTPDNSDVTPMYLAIVDKLDKAAVLDLLALVPASATSEEPVLFKRTAKGWERDDNMLSTLRSATPPPVVTLDAATYKDVVAQVDQTLTAEQAPDATAASGVMDLYNEYGELLPAMAVSVTPSAAARRVLSALSLPITADALTSTRNAILSADRTPVDVAGVGQIVPVLADGSVAGLSPVALADALSHAVPALSSAGRRVVPVLSPANTTSRGEIRDGSTLTVDDVSYRLQMLDADAVPDTAQVIEFAILRHGTVDSLPRRDMRETALAAGADSRVAETVELSVPQTTGSEFGAVGGRRTIGGVELHLLREAESVTGLDYGDSWHVAQSTLVAAGGLDRNRGGAERLRRYWTIGPGGAKIRWGQGGDWYRCVRHLSKYLGPRAKGYCFSGDTEFTTRDGVMSFADAVGTTQFVLTDHTPVATGQPVSTSGYWVEAPIMSFGEQPLRTVTLTRGRVTKTIRATPEHRWFVSPNGRNARRHDVAVVTTENLQAGMTLASIWAKKDGDLVPSFDGIRAGFIFGDGARASARSFAVDVWGDKRDDLLRYFSDYPMAERKLDTGVLGTRVSRVSVGGVDLKALPDMRNDLDYLYGWLAGYIAADGSVSPTGSLQLWSKDRENLEAAKHIATLLGIKTGVIGSRMRRGYLDHDTEIFWLSFMVNDIPDRLVLRKNHRELLSRDGVREKQTGVRWRVVSVEDHGDVEEVFCAVVPETESFVLTEGMWYPNCQLRHQEMVRMSTAQHAKLLRGKGGVRGGGFEYPDEQISVELASAWERAESAPMVASAAEGARFYIPIIVPEGVPTGDGRIFKPLAVTHRNLPIPLLWQMKTADGHDGSVVVGRIDSIERVANGLGNAYGVLDTSPHALEVERLIRNGFLRGVSADLDNFEAETTKNEDETLGKDDKSEKISADTTTISKARVMGVTAVPKPAFQECEIQLIEEEPEQQEDPVIPDGVYAERDDETLVACALVASQTPVVPPADWFTDPGLNEPTPLTVTDDGRVYGHIAAWHVDHIGMPFGTKPPRSRSGYKYFHTGVVRTDNGKDVPVGQLTLAGGHASLELSADAAVKHYDDTHSAVADVHAGEDAHGIWVAGALRPDVDASRIRSLRASAPSGDWRPIGGRLELVAVCQVNVPGFPVARARVASGYVTALVAAGAAPLAQLKGLSVEDRIKRLEDEALSAKMDALRERMAPAFAARSEELALRASAARERMEALRSSASDLADYSPDTRETYARKGWAMPDGSFPIANAGDLKNAVRAYGRAASGDRAKVRRHIMKRARGLGRADIIPTSWTSASIEERWQDVRAQFAELAQRPVTASAELTAQRDAAIARMNALLAAGPEFDPNKHPRSDETGQFREVLFRLNDTVKDAPNSESTSKEIDHVIELMDDGDLQKVKIATDNLLESVDQIAQQVDVSLPDLAHTIREGYSALGEAIARLPLAQGNDQERLRWSDLPPELQSLVDDVMTKLKTHVSDEAFRDITGKVSTYKSGIDTATSDEIQSWLARMVKYLLD